MHPPGLHKRHTQINFQALEGGSRPPSKNETVARREQLPTETAQADQCLDPGNKKRSLQGVDHTGSPAGVRDSRSPAAVKSKGRALVVIKSSPWEKYRKVYNLRLADYALVTVAELKRPWSEDHASIDMSGPVPYVFAVRSLSAGVSEEGFQVLQRSQHGNILSMREFFDHEGSIFSVSEHMPIALRHFAGVPEHLTEVQLASTLGQILDGLIYLANDSLEHGHLTSSNVLVNSWGHVKIANQECCHRQDAEQQTRDIAALSLIAMELMQKQVEDGGNIGVKDLQRWPADSKSVSFLSESTSETSLYRLRKHTLFTLPWGSDKLQGFVDLAMVAAFRGWELPVP